MSVEPRDKRTNTQCKCECEVEVAELSEEFEPRRLECVYIRIGIRIQEVGAAGAGAMGNGQ